MRRFLCYTGNVGALVAWPHRLETGPGAEHRSFSCQLPGFKVGFGSLRKEDQDRVWLLYDSLWSRFYPYPVGIESTHHLFLYPGGGRRVPFGRGGMGCVRDIEGRKTGDPITNMHHGTGCHAIIVIAN